MPVAGDDMVQSLWVRIRGKAHKVNSIAAAYYRSPNQDGDIDVLVCKEFKGNL